LEIEKGDQFFYRSHVWGQGKKEGQKKLEIQRRWLIDSKRYLRRNKRVKPGKCSPSSNGYFFFKRGRGNGEGGAGKHEGSAVDAELLSRKGIDRAQRRGIQKLVMRSSWSRKGGNKVKGSMKRDDGQGTQGCGISLFIAGFEKKGRRKYPVDVGSD